MSIIKAAFRGASQILKSGRGFTLVESLISILLIALMAVTSEGLIAYFAKCTKQDLTGECLLQAASSGIEAKRANPAVSSIKVTCAGQTVYVSMTGNPPSIPPVMGSGTSACADVVSTSTLGSRAMEMRDKICNFPEG
jgi:prepilin-type N-terminal cleavage/methylation domain-containing protein